MFTKDILPGDWVFVRQYGWCSVRGNADIGGVKGFWGFLIRPDGSEINNNWYSFHTDDILERIGDRPLANLGNMFGLPHMKPCHTCGGNGYLWEVTLA